MPEESSDLDQLRRDVSTLQLGFLAMTRTLEQMVALLQEANLSRVALTEKRRDQDPLPDVP